MTAIRPGHYIKRNISHFKKVLVPKNLGRMKTAGTLLTISTSQIRFSITKMNLLKDGIQQETDALSIDMVKTYIHDETRININNLLDKIDIC